MNRGIAWSEDTAVIWKEATGMKEFDALQINMFLSGSFIFLVLAITGMWFHFKDKRKGPRGL